MQRPSLRGLCNVRLCHRGPLDRLRGGGMGHARILKLLDRESQRQTYAVLGSLLLEGP